MAIALIPEFNLHDRMTKAREVAGFTQEQFAHELGLSLATVKRLENGTTPAKRIDLLGWAAACNVSASWLLTGHADTDSVTREYLNQLAFELVTAA
jgi:transcriptional regulator with XRE-family HTH domain